jgi:hypothetical protein
VHPPAILADAQVVPNAPGALGGHIPSFPLAELFVASGNMPINRETLYFNLAEADINLGMGGGFAGMEPQGFQVTLNVVYI